eukprot:3675803-Prymnesium_polylepis.1
MSVSENSIWREQLRHEERALQLSLAAQAKRQEAASAAANGAESPLPTSRQRQCLYAQYPTLRNASYYDSSIFRATPLRGSMRAPPTVAAATAARSFGRTHSARTSERMPPITAATSVVPTYRPLSERSGRWPEVQRASSSMKGFHNGVPSAWR